MVLDEDQRSVVGLLADDVSGIFERAGVVDLIPVNASFEIVPVHHAVGRFTEEGELPPL